MLLKLTFVWKGIYVNNVSETDTCILIISLYNEVLSFGILNSIFLRNAECKMHNTQYMRSISVMKPTSRFKKLLRKHKLTLKKNEGRYKILSSNLNG